MRNRSGTAERRLRPLWGTKAAFLVLPAADMTYDSLPVKVVLFPFREAILSSQIDGVVVKYNFRGGERFKKSDVLLKLDDKKYNNDLQRMRSLTK